MGGLTFQKGDLRDCTTRAPILTSRPRRVVNDQPLLDLMQCQRAQEIGEVVSQRVQFEPNGVEAHAQTVELGGVV